MQRVRLVMSVQGETSRAGASNRADDLVLIPGGAFLMGSDAHYPEEGPARMASVAPFLIERTPVTNRQYEAFVGATGYVTVAERTPSASAYPDASPDQLRPGSLVFSPQKGPVDLRRPNQWWRYVFGANWRWPEGPDGPPCRHDHPVVHVSYEDADAYAAWRGRSLPTEAQWEHAARGGLDGAEFAWGDVFAPGGRIMANTWFGQFPEENLKPHGFVRTSPVGSFPPNGYGLHDMIGNVWEWTEDVYVQNRTTPPRTCCSHAAQTGVTRKVLKGGSHLCAPNYCRRYRPAARHPMDADTGTTHVGFRCVAAAPD